MLQVDNQQVSATLPAIISLAARGGSGSGGVAEEQQPAAHLSVIKNLRVQGGAVDWWDYVSFRLLEIDVALEPPLLQALLDFALAAKLPQLIGLVSDIVPKAPDEERRERGRHASDVISLRCD